MKNETSKILLKSINRLGRVLKSKNNTRPVIHRGVEMPWAVFKNRNATQADVDNYWKNHYSGQLQRPWRDGTQPIFYSHGIPVIRTQDHHDKSNWLDNFFKGKLSGRENIPQDLSAMAVGGAGHGDFGESPSIVINENMVPEDGLPGFDGFNTKRTKDLADLEAYRHISNEVGHVDEWKITPELQALREKHMSEGSHYRENDDAFRRTIESRLFIGDNKLFHDEIPVTSEMKTSLGKMQKIMKEREGFTDRPYTPPTENDTQVPETPKTENNAENELKSIIKSNIHNIMLKYT
jgi:hypothetical protein